MDTKNAAVNIIPKATHPSNSTNENNIKKEHKLDLILDWVDVEQKEMRPYLRPGDKIGIEWLHPNIPNQLQVGDLVVGKHRGDHCWTVHRVVHTTDGYRIKGDNTYGSKTLDPQMIWAKAICIKRKKNGTTVILKANTIDRLIAKISHDHLQERTTRSRLYRRMIYLLGAIRKRTLSLPQ